MREYGLIGEPLMSASISQIRYARRRTDVVLGKNLGPLVDRVAGAVEHATGHVLGHGQLEARARELDVRRLDIDARRALEDLHDGLVAGDLEHLTERDERCVRPSAERTRRAWSRRAARARRSR